MRAVRFKQHGGRNTLHLHQVAAPEPGRTQAVAKVAACGVNRVDILAREGQTPAPIALPHTPGSEVSGEVIATGEGASSTPGDRILVNPVVSCGRCEFCLAGQDNACLKGKIFGVQTEGGYADCVLVEDDWLVHLPSNVSFEAAASVAVTGATAWHMLVTRACVHPGHDVLVIAAGSGIGALGIQIAKLSGARVFATAGSTAKREQALALGADAAFDHYDSGWPRAVRRATGGRGVDIVFEHVGEATWRGSLEALARGGTLVTCGGHSGFNVDINLWSLFVKEQRLIGSFAASTRDLLQVLRLVGEGRLAPVINRRLPLEEAAEAQSSLEEGAVFGKVLLVPQSP